MPIALAISTSVEAKSWRMPLGSLGPVIDALGLVEPIDRVGQGVVERVSHDGNTGCRADLIQTLGGTHGGELRTGIGARREADEALGTRARPATSVSLIPPFGRWWGPSGSRKSGASTAWSASSPATTYWIAASNGSWSRRPRPTAWR